MKRHFVLGRLPMKMMEHRIEEWLAGREVTSVKVKPDGTILIESEIPTGGIWL